MKKTIALLLCLLLTLGTFCACGAKDTAPETAPTTSPTEATKPKIPSVRFLNFQPALESAWEKLAADYTASTGVPVTVVTESPDNWRQSLDTRLSGEDAPTVFQLLRPTAADRWEALCYDLADTDAYEQLVDTGYALTDGDAVLALPCGLEAAGIWVNKALLTQAGYSPEDITSQAALKAVSEAVTADAETLNVSAFAFPGIAEDIHLDLAAAAIAWEFQQDALTEPEDLRGTALEGLRSLLDIMLQSSPEARTYEDALAAFLEGKALFFPGSTSDWEALSAAFAAEDLALIPAFLEMAEETEADDATEETAPTEETTAEEETRQGLCVGAAYFWCVNPDAPEQDLAVTLDFLDWCLGTEEGAAALSAMGYELPYLTAPESANPFLPDPEEEDLLLRRDWAIPSGQWKTALSSALADYTANPTDSRWNRVAEVFADYWAAEYALTDPAEETGES